MLNVLLQLSFLALNTNQNKKQTINNKKKQNYA